MNNLNGDRPPMQETIPYTLKLVWCPTLSPLSFTVFMLVAIWVMYIACLTQGIDTSNYLVLAPQPKTLLDFGGIYYYKLKDG